MGWECRGWRLLLWSSLTTKMELFGLLRSPYHVIITIPNLADAQQIEAAEQLYTQLNSSGIETLLDDRDERAGVKFKDADLMGFPTGLTGRSLRQEGGSSRTSYPQISGIALTK